MATGGLGGAVLPSLFGVLACGQELELLSPFLFVLALAMGSPLKRRHAPAYQRIHSLFVWNTALLLRYWC